MRAFGRGCVLDITFLIIMTNYKNMNKGKFKMVAIKLPDGSQMDMESGVNGFDIANKISANLAKAALPVKIKKGLKLFVTPAPMSWLKL